ncbi:hypothetical protein Patl1_20470 [Pistacia atlantica]|uniref:Uncharacterized protein n=1 Tax=Pistacia atlantica TaxID=434234 RepID=A0ACC1BIZ1_9ROSI|nr:hypothetical protein Patl1_20470 [Pistacia atlantica]
MEEQVHFNLGVLDLGMALDEQKPTDITNTSTGEEKFYRKSLYKANKLCLMFMRMTTAGNIKDTVPQTDNAKEYLSFVEDRFCSANKSLSTMLMSSLIVMKYDSSRSMHDHLIEMTNIVTKLRRLGMTIDDDFFIHFILHSLPPKYGTFQVNYNAIKDKWSLNELSS